MTDLFTILLIIHIAGGSVSLLLGLYILLSKKGNRVHRKTGIVYFYAMLTASLVALPMSYLHPNYFLFIIGVFTSYMLLTGKRYLKKKTPEDVHATDWLLTTVMLIFGLAFIFFGIFNIVKGVYFGTVFLVLALSACYLFFRIGLILKVSQRLKILF